jgi:enoyl-CoA hydratase
VIDVDAYEFLRFTRRENGVLLLELNRPEQKNSMNPALHTELSRVWTDIDADADVRVVVLTGAGKAFSVGGAADEIDMELFDVDYTLGQIREITAIVYGMIRMRQPIIAAVNGTASAGGLAVALTSDISIVSETAKLIDPHVLGGLAAGDHSAMMWPLLCGMAKAKYYIFSGEVFTGKEAERIGLVSKCVPADDVLPAALALADKLAAGSQVGIQLSKKALNGWFQLASPIFEHSVALEMLTFLHPDAAEGMQAGTERRLPVFPSTLPRL